MLRLLLRNRVTVLIIITITLLTTFALHTLAEETTGTISGRVVDIDGHPIPKLPIYIAPIAIEGAWAQTIFLPVNYSLLHRAQTDGIGQFTITGIPEGSFYFGLLPFNFDKLLPQDFEKKLDDYIGWNPATYHPDYLDVLITNNFGMVRDDFKPDFEIQSLLVQGITLYPHGDFDGVAFGVDPGTHIKDIEIVVKTRMRVQGQMLFKDGTPLTNSRLSVRTKFIREDGRGSGGGPTGFSWIDENGSFVFYLNKKRHTGLYTFTVKYQNLEVTADTIRIAPGDRLDGLKFIFDSDPIPPKPIPPKLKTDTEKPQTQPRQEPPSRSESNEVWIVNPANRHAYKRILCESFDDAVAQATEEKAHIVTINDIEEQRWLTAVFGHEFYWIGLSDTKKEGEWQWQNGEPVIYQNWLPDGYFFETWDAEERDNVVTSFVDGKWYAVSPNSVIVNMTKMAIIEKVDLKIKLQEKKK